MAQNAHGMISKMHFVKQVLIPHRHNSYRPHLIRRHGLAFALLLIIASQIGQALQTDAQPHVLGYASNITISGLLSSTNSERAAANKSSLGLSAKLNSSAQAKANDMIQDNYWAHNSPDGKTPWYWFDQAGYDYLVAGENLAYGFDTSSGVINGWMNSPSHRDNMLNSAFEQVGFGIANGSNYQGGPNTVVVAHYGDPAVSTQSSPPPSSSSSKPKTAAAPTASKPAAAEPVPQAAVEKPKSKDNAKTDEIDLAPAADPTPAPVTFASDEPKIISNWEALLTGQAGWALYTAAAVAGSIGFVYAYRHVLFIHKVVIRGEDYILSHPLLEASIIYALIWLLLSATFGSVL